MLGHSPLATQPYGAGHQHLNATVNLSAFSPLALSLGTTGIEISKNVDAPAPRRIILCSSASMKNFFFGIGIIIIFY